MGVHVFMYFYYFMSSFGPSVQKYLWWKRYLNSVLSIYSMMIVLRYLTTMQLVQFATFFIHATFPLLIDCNFPKEYSYVILFHGAMFFALFLNFYIQAYIKKGSKPAAGHQNGSLKKVE